MCIVLYCQKIGGELIAKFKFANILCNGDFGANCQINSSQYFQLCGIVHTLGNAFKHFFFACCTLAYLEYGQPLSLLGDG